MIIVSVDWKLKFHRWQNPQTFIWRNSVIYLFLSWSCYFTVVFIGVSRAVLGESEFWVDLYCGKFLLCSSNKSCGFFFFKKNHIVSLDVFLSLQGSTKRLCFIEKLLWYTWGITRCYSYLCYYYILLTSVSSISSQNFKRLFVWLWSFYKFSVL